MLIVGALVIRTDESKTWEDELKMGRFSSKSRVGVWWSQGEDELTFVSEVKILFSKVKADSTF